MAAEASTVVAGTRGVYVFDTAIASNNLGDAIIMDAVWGVFHEIFGRDARPPRIATHTYMSRHTYGTLGDCELAIVGGTNILKSHMFVRANWRLRPYDMFFIKNVVLLGVGWQQYQRRDTDVFSRLLFSRILSRTFVHSVRDEYTLAKMHRQVKNIAYTACPTLWPLNAARCSKIPTTKAPAVIVSLTYYRPDPADTGLIELLRNEYETVYFWCQQDSDREYLAGLKVGTALETIDDLDAYDRLLETGRVDVIGTRLHGGIRALQRGCRALILAVDNRALELARSTGIPVVDRRDMDTIRGWIRASPQVSITLPWEAIDAWKRQFAEMRPAALG